MFDGIKNRMVDIKDKIGKGWIHSRMLIEIIGKPKEFVEETCKKYIEKIKQDKDIDVLHIETDSAEEVKEMQGFYATFIDLETLMPSLNMLVGFCFDYMPSSVEIIHPEKITFANRELSSFINELQQKLHSLDMMLKQNRNENEYLTRNVHQLLRNVVNLILLKQERTAQEIGNVVGLAEDKMKIFLDNLVKENKLERNGEKYRLTKKNEQ